MAPLRRRAVIPLVAAGSLWLAASCATMNVNSYASRGSDFRHYRTYNWSPPDTRPTGDPRLDNNRFFDERIRGQVEQELERRGFTKTAPQQADVLVHYHASVSQQIDVRDLDNSRSYCADHDCRPFIYDKGTLFVDLVEPRTNRLIWRGWAEGSVDGVIDDQNSMESLIDEAVAKLLARLPSRL